MSATKPAKSRQGAQCYADGRFSKLDQRLVHALESRVIFGFVDELLPAGSSILDMPAGCGRFAQPLFQRDFMVTAGDAKQERLELLAERTDNAIKVLRLRGESLPFEDNEFDGAICVRLLQHMRDGEQRRAILNELGRVTRKGVILTVYTSSRAHRLVHSARRQKRLFHYEHSVLEEELAAAGLAVGRVTRPIPLHAQTVVQALPA